MTLADLDTYFNSFLNKESFLSDPSKNGIQIENSASVTKKIEKVAFAVDACVATAEAAFEAGAQLLFVHHGLFWGDCQPVTGSHYKRIASFLKHDLALYASHIPLDANPVVGNNYGLAARLGLEDLKPFAEWRGMTIGVKGILHCPLSAEQLAAGVLGRGEKPVRILPFGKKQLRTVGIISGGAGEDVDQAVRAGLDAYVTGEVGHEMYHYIEENEITVVAGGHYQTETIGVNLVRQKLEKETGMQTVFIDIPTGL
jgi:dinuclear metal center YbgI/SA1388 family protein